MWDNSQSPQRRESDLAYCLRDIYDALPQTRESLSEYNRPTSNVVFFISLMFEKQVKLKQNFNWLSNLYSSEHSHSIWRRLGR